MPKAVSISHVLEPLGKGVKSLVEAAGKEAPRLGENMRGSLLHSPSIEKCLYYVDGIEFKHDPFERLMVSTCDDAADVFERAKVIYQKGKNHLSHVEQPGRDSAYELKRANVRFLSYEHFIDAIETFLKAGEETKGGKKKIGKLREIIEESRKKLAIEEKKLQNCNKNTV